MRSLARVLAAGAVFAGSAAAPARAYVFGTLRSAVARAVSVKRAGAVVVTVSVRWELFEPQRGVVSEAYVKKLQATIGRFRFAGLQVILDLGMHYAPAWVGALPQARLVDQYGDEWLPREEGREQFNGIFCEQVRDAMADYVDRIFAALGTDYFAVRLGWGVYGEIHYPFSFYGAHRNCYWAYDDFAQGKRKGLPPGMKPCPVPGWRPGTRSVSHAAAAAFLEWYFASLVNFQEWEIATVRTAYPGRLLMMYPSWGIRPGEAEGAIAHDLDGSTPAERPSRAGPDGGQIPRGYDFARLVAGIREYGVYVYTTNLSADDSGDGAEGVQHWSPIHFLASLAARNPIHPPLYGENAGHGDVEAMQRSFAQMEKYHLLGLNWAFEDQLFAPPPSRLATIADYARAISSLQQEGDVRAQRGLRTLRVDPGFEAVVAGSGG